jgi:hypothetical protein
VVNGKDGLRIASMWLKSGVGSILKEIGCGSQKVGLSYQNDDISFLNF